MFIKNPALFPGRNNRNENCSRLRFGYSSKILMLVCGFNLLLSISFAAAQDTVTGAFQGNVSNIQTGIPVIGAEVEITNEQTGIVYRLNSDSKGRFYQGLLAPGFYQISVAFNGFKSRLLRREIKVSLTGDVVPVPVLLEPDSSQTPSAAVMEEPDDIRVEINTTDARRDGSTKKDEITQIPLGSTSFTRSFDEFALLLPGVAPPPQTIGDVAGPGVGPGVGSAGQFAVNGLRSRANNFTVDGSDNNDEDIGVRRQGFVALIPQPIESIQEFQIITLLSPAQFGRNIGAQVNAVSRAGGNQINGSVYGFFNSNQLNARNFLDTTNGNDTFALRSASGQSVLLDGQPLMVRNQSGGEDPFTFGQAGGVLGGAIIQNKLFYFISGEYQKINATQEKNFAVPTIEQRGAFRTGATGVFRNPFNNAILPNPAIPNDLSSAALFSLFPFSNNPNGIYGANTFSQTLPAGGRGVILSGRIDNNFSLGNRNQSITGRYNFTDDEKNISSINEALFSTVLSKINTHNVALFLNSQINAPNAEKQVFNQLRFSFGRTHLNFNEVRDTEFLFPSNKYPNAPLLLNTKLFLNVTRPPSAGNPNTGAVLYNSFFTAPNGIRLTTTEPFIGPIGQVKVAGFSPLGTDVYNFPQNRVNNTFQLADELTIRFGNHSQAFGVDTRRTDLNSDLPRLARPLVTFNGSPRLIFENGALRFPNMSDLNPIIRPEDLLGLNTASDFLLTFNVDRPDSKVNLRYYQLNIYGQDTWRIRPNLSLSYGLRYEYNTPVKEANGLIEKTFSDPRLSFVSGLSQFIDGRTSLYEPDYNNFAPRIGIAYSPNFFGRGKLSVVRVGYGIFYDQILGAVVNQSRNVFPTFLTLNYGGINDPMGEVSLALFNPGNTTTTLGNQNYTLNEQGTVNIFNRNLAARLGEFIQADRLLFPNAVNVTLPSRNLEMPMAHHYSFFFEQQLNSNYSISAGYVGTLGRKLLRFETPNLGSSITTAPTSLETVQLGNSTFFVPTSMGRVFTPNRRVSNLGSVNLFSTTAGSTYNSLQTQLRGRFINSLNFQLSYTYSKAVDDVSDVFDLAGASVLPQNSLTFAGEHAPANFDVRHLFTYNAIYNIPQVLDRGGFLRWLTDGLQIASIGRFHTGQPFTVNSIIDVNLDGNLTDRLNNTNGIVVTGDGRQPLRLDTNNPFTLLAPFGQDGQLGRNSFRVGKVLELDLSIFKIWTFAGRSLLFRTDIFNFINRANYGIPVRYLEAPGFGRATNTVTPARRIQFSLKYTF